jgi:peptidoglycan/LPS O-acetylase OafA/YrhL
MSSKVFFPNLNGIRFIAAFAVIIHHIEQTRFIFKISNFWFVPAVEVVGKLGVVLFFVLSGFLITYLILKEKEVTKTIAVKEFYIRRVLRIWPLYFLIAFLGFFVLPNFEALHMPGWSSELSRHFLVKIILYVLILPNLALTLFAPVPFASQAWSIGVEEQFYLIWPVLLKIFKKIINMLLGVIVVYLAIKFLLIGIKAAKPDLPYMKMVINFWRMFSIDCMAIGGIAAWALFEKKTAILNILFNKYIQLFTYAVLVIFIAKGVYVPYFHYEFYAILFAILILNLAANPNSILSLENKVFNYLGKVSYGLYMFHQLAIIISLKTLEIILPDNHIAHYLLAIALTVIFASLSYYFFELRFIKRKVKFSKVLSGENAVPVH